MAELIKKNKKYIFWQKDYLGHYFRTVTISIILCYYMIMNNNNNFKKGQEDKLQNIKSFCHCLCECVRPG